VCILIYVNNTIGLLLDQTSSCAVQSVRRWRGACRDVNKCYDWSDVSAQKSLIGCYAIVGQSLGKAAAGALYTESVRQSVREFVYVS